LFTDPRLIVKKTKYAIGIDTGCVFGGKLTAVVFKLHPDKDEWDNDNYEIVQVASKREYAEAKMLDQE